MSDLVERAAVLNAIDSEMDRYSADTFNRHDKEDMRDAIRKLPAAPSPAAVGAIVKAGPWRASADFDGNECVYPSLPKGVDQTTNCQALAALANSLGKVSDVGKILALIEAVEPGAGNGPNWQFGFNVAKEAIIGAIKGNAHALSNSSPDAVAEDEYTKAAVACAKAALVYHEDNSVDNETASSEYFLTRKAFAEAAAIRARGGGK